MRAERLRCPNCLSDRLTGILAHESNAAPMIYTACASCGTLLAAFRAHQGFINSNDPQDVAGMLGVTEFESGRELTDALARLRERAEQGYAEARQAVEPPPDAAPDA